MPCPMQRKFPKETNSGFVMTRSVNDQALASDLLREEVNAGGLHPNPELCTEAVKTVRVRPRQIRVVEP